MHLPLRHHRLIQFCCTASKHVARQQARHASKHGRPGLSSRVALATVAPSACPAYEAARDLLERAQMAATGERLDSTSEPILPRVIALQGVSNLRDAGGWPVGIGRMREGLVYRSAALDRMTDADQPRIAALGLRTLCDFRGVAEAKAAPSRLESFPDIERHALPIEPSVGASLRDIATTRAATGEDVGSLMRRAYVSYAMEHANRYHALFDLLLEEGRLPLLYHCSAGKDRTGFATALLLSALGVSWDLVMEDYLATNRIWRGDSRMAAELPEDVGAQLLRVSPDYLEAAFKALKREYGSLDRYLERALGLIPRSRDRLASLLLA